MPVRGERSTFPKAPKPPTGIFSSRGKQKTDPTSHYKHQDQLAYAYGSGTRSKPKSTAAPRHQPPK